MKLYTHPLEHVQKHGAAVREALAQINARPASHWAENEPLRRRCSGCNGQGCTIVGGQITTCAECRGFRDVAMTTEELRQTYAELKTALCSRLETSGEAFDALVALGLPGEPTPSSFVRVALEIARKTGLQKK